MKQPHVVYASRFFKNNLSIPSLLDERVDQFSKQMGLIEMRERLANIFYRWISDKDYCLKLNLDPEIVKSSEKRRELVAQNVACQYLINKKGIEVYKICDDFAHALKSAPINVPAKHIDFSDRMIYVELPESLRLMPPGQYHGFYVDCCRLTDSYKEALNDPELDDKSYSIRIRFPINGKINTPEVTHAAVITISLNEYDNIAETIYNRLHADPNLDPYWKTYRTEVFEYVAKVLLYINSGDPDLRHLKPVREIRGLRAFKRRRQHGYEVPVTLVGFNYKKPFLYGKSQTLVSTHPRWQPCGKNREQIKLIWVREHVRHYAQREVIQGV